jgi:hypothetical protein
MEHQKDLRDAEAPLFIIVSSENRDIIPAAEAPMSEEYVLARQEELEKYREEMSAFRQKARDEGSSDSPAFLNGMKAVGRKFGISMPWPNLAEGPNEMVPEVDPDKFKDFFANYCGGGMVGLAGLPRSQGPTEEGEAEALRARAMHLNLLHTNLLESDDTAKLPVGVPDLFFVLKKDGRISSTAIRVFARFAVKKPALGINPPSLFDIEGFIREIQRESSEAKEGEWTELS